MCVNVYDVFLSLISISLVVLNSTLNYTYILINESSVSTPWGNNLPNFRKNIQEFQFH